MAGKTTLLLAVMEAFPNALLIPCNHTGGIMMGLVPLTSLDPCAPDADARVWTAFNTAVWHAAQATGGATPLKPQSEWREPLHSSQWLPGACSGSHIPLLVLDDFEAVAGAAAPGTLDTLWRGLTAMLPGASASPCLVGLVVAGEPSILCPPPPPPPQPPLGVHPPPGPRAATGTP
jgi:hypothetical protein